jgi:hypothetical protein
VDLLHDYASLTKLLVATKEGASKKLHVKTHSDSVLKSPILGLVRLTFQVAALPLIFVQEVKCVSMPAVGSEFGEVKWLIGGDSLLSPLCSRFRRQYSPGWFENSSFYEPLRRLRRL